MEIDWASVKKMTLWNYENLTRKILQVLSYNFIQEYYNHNMKEAERYAIKLLGYDPKYAKYLRTLPIFSEILIALESRTILTWSIKWETRKYAKYFLERQNCRSKI